MVLYLPHEARPHRHPGPQRGAAGHAQPAQEGQAGAAERGPGLPGGGQSDAKYYVKEGSNLFFEMKKDGKAIDPMVYLPAISE